MEQKSFPIHAPEDAQLGGEEPTNRDPLLTLGEGNAPNREFFVISYIPLDKLKNIVYINGTM